MRFSPYQWTAADMIGGDPSLDFVNTASKWSEAPIDRLGDLEGFRVWAAGAGILDDAEAAAMRAAIARQPAEAAAVFERATALRQSLWRLFAAAAKGERADPGDLDRLKDWTCRAATFLTLEQTGKGFQERCTSDTPILETAIFRIAGAAQALLKDGRLNRLHVCGGDGCEWLFLDASKNASRRWCSMATCGNDAKIKKFRRRKAAAAR